MAEYIDRGTAIAKLTALDVSEPNATMVGAKRLLAEIPAADVAPVVRCKDCKYRVYKDMGGEIGEIGGCALFNCAMPNDEFCSCGERRGGTDAEG